MRHATSCFHAHHGLQEERWHPPKVPMIQAEQRMKYDKRIMSARKDSIRRISPTLTCSIRPCRILPNTCANCKGMGAGGSLFLNMRGWGRRCEHIFVDPASHLKKVQLNGILTWDSGFWKPRLVLETFQNQAHLWHWKIPAKRVPVTSFGTSNKIADVKLH
jgi:hypothetical protein